MKKTLLNLLLCTCVGLSASAQNLITNGGFELPSDGAKYTNINDVPNWYSNDTVADHNGREPNTQMAGNYREYSVNTAMPVYQPIDVVSVDSAKYYVSYLSMLTWNDDAGNDTVYSVVYLSHYSTGNRQNRTIIDSIATDITNVKADTLINVSFKLPAGLSYAGDTLVVEFATRVVDHNKVNTNTWTGMDNVVVTKNMQWSVFSIDNPTDVKYITGPKDYSAQVSMRWDMDSVYMIFNVMDDTVTTITDPSIWNNDNIEIYFDMTNGKIAQWPRTSGWPPSYDQSSGARIPGSGYYQFRVVPDSSWSTYNGDAATTTNLTYTRTADGYIFNVRIPWDTLYSSFTPAVGTEIGFDVNASDNDSIPNYRDQLTFNSPTTSIYADAALWGTLKLDNNGTFVKVPDTQAPTAPTNLVAKAVNDTAVALTWDASTDNIVVQNYIIYQDNAPIDTIMAVQTSNAYTTPHMDTGSYSFTVAALDLYNNMSAQSTAATVSLKAPVDTTTKTSINASVVDVAKVYPNPSSGLVTISSSSSDQISFDVVDISGKQIMSGTFTKNYQFDLGKYGKGVYIIRMTTKNTTEVTRLIVK